MAATVRTLNSGLFAPDFEFPRLPDLLVGEPALAGGYTLPDGRTWLRVYLDGSALDQTGTVWRRPLRRAA